MCEVPLHASRYLMQGSVFGIQGLGCRVRFQEVVDHLLEDSDGNKEGTERGWVHIFGLLFRIEHSGVLFLVFGSGFRVLGVGFMVLGVGFGGSDRGGDRGALCRS